MTHPCRAWRAAAVHGCLVGVGHFDRKLESDARALARVGGQLEAPAARIGPHANRRQPDVPSLKGLRGAAWVHAAAVVVHFEDDLSARALEVDRDEAGVGVLDDIAKQLPHHRDD